MPDLDINDIGEVGLILDVPGYQLAPEAWTGAINVRVTLDGVEKGSAWSEFLDTSVATAGAITDPWHVAAVSDSDGLSHYVFADLTAVWASDQTTAADISGAAYTTATGKAWQSEVFNGTLLMTNNSEPPQYWTSVSLASNLADLPQWTADLGANSFAKVVRAHGPYLVAIGPTIAGVPYPHGVLWSHPADPGTLPASWDYTDPTKDAGLQELSDAAAGVLLDGKMLKGQMILYKENSAHTMRLVGGDFIFQFDNLFSSSGLLATGCVALTGDGRFHFLATQDDLVVHDGVNAQSVAEKRVRKTLFNRIDSTNFANSFVFGNPAAKEMWFVYPEHGSTYPTRAMVWSYGSGSAAGVLYECEFPFVSATTGDVVAPGDTWDADSGTWDTDDTVWDQSSKQRVIFADWLGGRLGKLDDGTTRFGVPFVGAATRNDLAVIGRRRSGEPIVDFRTRKFVRRVWAKVQGQPLAIRVGFAETVGGNVTYSPAAQALDPATQKYVDFNLSGASSPNIEFTFPNEGESKLFGYTVELESAGRF